MGYEGVDETEAVWQRVYAHRTSLTKCRKALATVKRRAKAAAGTMEIAARVLEIEGEGANDPTLDGLVRRLRRQAKGLR